MNIHTKQSDRGNALFIVLIAIILLAGLAVALKGTESNSQMQTKNEVKLQADELLAYLASVQAGVRTVMTMNGTAETQISFEDPRPNQTGADADTTNTRNPNARGDQDKVFNTNSGGMVQWKDFGYITQNRNSSLDFNNQLYSSGMAVQDVGSTKADLVFLLRDIPAKLCFEINQRVGLPTVEADTPLDSTLSILHYKGSYGAAALGGGISGQPYGCFRSADSPAYYWMYYVILAR